jgi:hypothetical protein
MEKYEGKNLATVRTLKLIALDALTFIPNKPVFDYSELTIASPYEFETIAFTHLSAKWGEKENSGKGGNFLKKEVFCSIPCVRSEISEELENFRGRRLAALVEEENGETRLVYPLRMKINTDVPGSSSGWNGYDLSFSGDGTKQAPSVTNAPDSGELGI